MVRQLAHLETAAWWIVTMKVPPVDGWRATSPREVENVLRSSWAYCVFHVNVCQRGLIA